jgi:uncharacterized protein YjbI with pentapeptide repeats
VAVDGFTGGLRTAVVRGLFVWPLLLIVLVAFGVEGVQRLTGEAPAGRVVCSVASPVAAPLVLDGCRLDAGMLRNRDLYGAHLRGVLARRIGLPGRDLRGVDASGAVLADAVLTMARLDGARLRGADLRRATLRRACLRYADLRGADLRGADFTGADVTGTDIRGAAVRGRPIGWGTQGSGRPCSRPPR